VFLVRVEDEAAPVGPRLGIEAQLSIFSSRLAAKKKSNWGTGPVRTDGKVGNK